MSLRSVLVRLGLATAATAVLAAGTVAALTWGRAPSGPPELFIPLGHAGPARSLAWSPDGKLLASGGTDAVLKIWDPASGTLLRSIAGHDDPITIAGWSADGQLLATNAKYTISLWRPDSGALVRRAAQDAVRIGEPAWSPDGKLFAGIVDLEEGRGSLGSVRIWRADTGAIVTTFGDHFDYIHDVAWSPDSQKLAVSGTVLKIWNAGSGVVLPFRSDQNGGMYNQVAFSPDGKILAERGDYHLQVWRTDVGAMVWRIHDNDCVSAMAWSSDGRSIATGTSKGVRVRRADTGAEMRSFAGPLERMCEVAWSPDGKTIASSSCEATVKLWNADTGALLRDLSTQPNSIFAVSWSPDGQTIASGSRDGMVNLWRASSGNLVRGMAGHSAEVLSLSWSPDSRAIASGGRDRTAKIWDEESGALRTSMSGKVFGVDPQPGYGNGVNGVIVAWSPDGRTLGATGFDDKKVKLWNPESGALLRTLETPETSIYSLSWSGDSGTLAAGGGFIQMWRFPQGAVKVAQPVGHATARHIALRPDGKVLANAAREHYGENRGAIELLRVSSAPGAGLTPAQRERYPFGGEGPSLVTRDRVMQYLSDCEAAVWSSDGRTLATAHDDGSIQLWDGATGTLLRSLTGHTGYVLSAAWSPDNRKLVSGGDDGTLRIWDAATGEMESVATLLPEHGWITVLPKTLLYSSSSRGDEFARIRFGTRWKELFPLSQAHYRRALKRDDVRMRMSEAAPAVRLDPWFVAGALLKEPKLIRGVAWLYGVLIVAALVLPWRSHWMLSAVGAAAASTAIIVWTVYGLGRAEAPPATAPAPMKVATSGPPAAAEPHQPRVNPRDGLTYVWIPPGAFVMGCSPADDECRANEKPAHPVTISEGFWMGQTPVTAAAYQRYAEANHVHMPSDPSNPWRKFNEAGGDGRIPVVGVVYNEAKAYCEGVWMRLPTEAEWEYAARAGGTGARYGELEDIAWYADNSGQQRLDSRSMQETAFFDALRKNGNFAKPVAQKEPNAWGLYDMLGNVWQFTAGQHDLPYSLTAAPDGGPSRYTVLRGGSWYDPPRLIRASARESRPGSYEAGFRCAGSLQ